MNLAMDGTVRFHMAVQIDARELATWPPERITQLFEGLALAVGAYYDTLPPAPLLLTYRPDLGEA